MRASVCYRPQHGLAVAADTTRPRYAPIAAIQLAQAAGFSLAEMKRFLVPSENQLLSSQWQQLAPQKISEIDQMMARLEEMKAQLQAGLDCSCQGITDCQAVTRRLEG